MSSMIIKTSALAVSSALVLTGCGGGGGSSSSGDSSLTTSSYAGPGSKWDASLNSDNTFTIIRRDSAGSSIDFEVDGTYATLPTGFLKLTISTVSASNPSTAPSVDDQAYALEVPDYTLFLKPISSSDDQIISMVTSGECPSGDFIGNWVNVKTDGDTSDGGRDFFGTFSFSASTGLASLPDKWALTSGYPDVSGGSIPPGSCADGIMTVGTEGVMYLTQGRGAIVHTYNGTPDNVSDDQFIFALEKQAISSITNLDGTYSGLLFDENQTSGAQIQPVQVSCSSGSCTGQLFDNIETGTFVSGASVTISLSSTVDDVNSTAAPGFVTGTVNNGFGTGNLSCMVNLNAGDSGKKMMSCVGQSPDDNTDLFNVLLVSQ